MTLRLRTAVAAAITDGGAVLLVRRANPPSPGAWALPGGRVEADEPLEAALRREVLEETGLVVRIGGFRGVVDRPDPEAGIRWVIVVLDASPHDPAALRPGDDALEVRWWPVELLGDPGVVPGLGAFLTRTGAVPSGVRAGAERP